MMVKNEKIKKESEFTARQYPTSVHKICSLSILSFFLVLIQLFYCLCEQERKLYQTISTSHLQITKTDAFSHYSITRLISFLFSIT